ncbi:MAG: BatD family protein [Cyanobacteriota bacterium]
MKKIIIGIIITILTLALLIAGGYALYNIGMDQFGYNVPELTKDKPYNLSAQLSKEQVDIGEPFTYTVKLYKLKDADVKLEKYDIKKDKEKFKNINPYNLEEEVKVVRNKSVEIITQKYYLQPEDNENVEIPAIIAKASGKEIKLDPVKLKPKSVLNTANPMKDIHDIKPIDKFMILKWWYFVAPIAAILFLALFIFIVYKLLTRPKEINKEELLLPPHLLAYKELEELKKIDLKSYEDYKLFYSGLSEILRKYLEGRFNIKAIEKTSEEINVELIRIKFNLNTRNLAKQILRQSDMVKFAKHHPSKETALSSLEKTYEFVDTTKLELEVNFDTRGT